MTTVYSSGILVLGFIGVCGLVVTIQLIPAIMTCIGMIKGVKETKMEKSQC